MANIFASLPGMKHMMSYWYQFIIMFEALFILTTIDAGTRVARYILQDILGNVYEPLKKTDWIPGVVLTSAVVSSSWGYLLYTGDISSIWPMFGTANQLLAVLALCIGTTIILKIAVQKTYALVAFFPLTFLAATTITAAAMNIHLYMAGGKTLMAGLSAALIILVSVVLLDNLRYWFQLLKNDKPIGMNDGRDTTYCPVIPPNYPPDIRP
jgi:carbon starvation protein